MAGSSVEVARLQVALLVVLVIATATCFQAVRGQDDGAGLIAGDELITGDEELSIGDEVQSLRAGDGASNLHRALRSTTSRISRQCRICPKTRTCCYNRYCVDLKTDENNCGSCGRRCNRNRECCNGRCVDTNRSNSNCGQCGVKCPSNLTCEYGFCGYNN